MRTLLTTMIAAVLSVSTTSVHAQMQYGVDKDNAIYKMDDLLDPPEMYGPYPVSGITVGQVITSLDTSPTDGGLYALGYDNSTYMAQLYRINTAGELYIATPVNAPVRMQLGSASDIDFRFNPSMDNMIIVAANNGYTRYMLDAETGSVLDISNSAWASNVGQVSTQYELVFYPNPVASQARIELPYYTPYSVYVDIIDLRGQVVAAYAYAPGSYVLDLDMSNVPTGLYNVRVIEKGKGIQSIKVAKE